MINYHKLNSLFKKENFESCLKLIQKEVEKIIYNPKYTAKIFFDSKLDELCKKIGGEIQPPNKNSAPSKNTDIYIVSRLDEIGGGSKMLYDMIKCSTRKHIILATNILPSSVISKNNFIKCNQDTLVKKIQFIKQFIYKKKCKNIWLLNAHQDSVAIAACTSLDKEIRVNYIHHCDHNLALGATIKKFKHYDPHVSGFNNCKKKNIKNSYIPLISTDYGKSNVLFNAKKIKTCTVANYNKFLLPYHKSYFELIPNLLKEKYITHYHVGRLNIIQLSKIYINLLLNNICLKKFIYVPNNKNIWKFLKKNKIHFLISSFPQSAYKTIIESMGCGVPVIIHENKISKILSGSDVVSKYCPSWKNYRDIIKFFRNISTNEYKLISYKCREKYKKHHSTIILKKFFNKKFFIVPPPIEKNYYLQKIENKYNLFQELEIYLINTARLLRKYFI
jgi:hypothetical protein